MPIDERVDIHVSANLGVFGLLVPDKFSGAFGGTEVKDAVSGILEMFSFPSLNFVYSAAGRLKAKGEGALKVATALEEMELRAQVVPLDEHGREIGPADSCSVLGIYPDQTEATGKEPAFQVAPDLGVLLGAIPAISPWAGLVSALGVTLPALFRPSFPVIEKAFMANSREFGWYARSAEESSKEGIRYGVAVLQLKRSVPQLRVHVTLATDWIKNVDPQVLALDVVLPVTHPIVPKTPQLTDLSSPDGLPLTVLRDDVRTLLAIDNDELDQLIQGGTLTAFGAAKYRITKGSLLKALGMERDTK